MTLPSRSIPTFCVALGGLVIISALVSSSPASAHAIVELNGVSAVAGKSSVLTLEIQHGCLTGQDGTTQVIAFAGKPWGAIKPAAVSGWTSLSARLADGGQQITWTSQGAPQPFGTPMFFPMTVRWPKSAGIYGLRVLQVCPSGVTWWDTPFIPATASAPAPPLTPLPQVQVLP
ncbi:MAG: hypothetical protein O2943_02020 [Actinomycetota bacterium]|nr:hypothetical protein [Actinomycetota bacterium]